VTHDHHPAELPPIPFTEKDLTTMYAEDKKAAWDIARLTGGIFTFGLILYTGVLIWMFAAPRFYLIR